MGNEHSGEYQEGGQKLAQGVGQLRGIGMKLHQTAVSPVKKYALIALTVYIAFVFIQSLFFKFTNSPETQYIFGTLNTWGATLGFPGLFAPRGIFSQYVVGSMELVASALLLTGFFLRKPVIHALGALMAVGVISGAIFFHLFTPLGVQVLNTDGTLDGGELFALACGVWLAAMTILVLRRADVLEAVNRFKGMSRA
jgi:uncharacterized membrane protein YphA (DoxX/SURF4 family)